ncbi:MAG: type III pantothenate kinase [Candidatus Omnitrophota bacterium]
MLLAIDIGNTNISFGVFRGNRIIKRFNIPTREVIHSRRGRLNVPYGKLINDAIICSVVPEATKIIERGLKPLIKIKPYILGKNVSVPIKNLYRKPSQVGQDRLVNAYAGLTLYGAPLVVVDFGTAITFDVISKNGAYLGGMILPGLRISLAALSQQTALLPLVKLCNPKELIGRDTKYSILSGIIYGYAALTDGMIGKIKRKIGKNALVISTGGNANLVSKYCTEITKIDGDLTLMGLNFIYRNLV